MFENWRDSAPGVLLLRGPGGVGKTALALRWLNDVVNEFPDGQLYADLCLSTGEAVTPEDVLGQFLRALGVSPRRVPTGLAERTTLYRSVTAGRALAVLLDNAVSAAQVRVLLPTSPRSLAVITSRHRLLGLMAEGVQVLSVGVLDQAGGVELLTSAIGRQRVADERAAAERLIELCGGMPVALCVVAARAAVRPRRPLARMVEELVEERTRLDALSVEGELSVRSTLDIAYACLPEPLQKCYRVLGIHPGKVFSMEAVAAAIGIEPATCRRYLDELVDVNLLEELGESHYRFHDLVRVHALDQALTHDHDDVREASTRRTLQWYLMAAQAANRTIMPARRVLTYGFPDQLSVDEVPLAEPAGAIDWLEQHLPNLVAAIRDAAKLDLPLLCYHLADALQPLFILHNHDADAVDVDELGLRAAEAAGEVRVEFSMRKRLSRLYAYLGDFARAEELAAELLRRARARQDLRNEASALKSLGLLAARQGRLAAAERFLTDALHVLRPLGRNRSEGLLLIDMGVVLYQAGKIDEAGEHLRAAVRLLSGLNPADTYNLARAGTALAGVHVRTGAPAQARALLEEAIKVFAESGADAERAGAHRIAAELGRSVGDPAMAERHDGIADNLLRKQRA
jgi:tetratricopeptide (TPR) repeat protein